MPKRFRKKLDAISVDSDKRLSQAKVAHAQAVTAAAGSQLVSARSNELEAANNIASVIARSLRLPSTGKEEEGNHA